VCAELCRKVYGYDQCHDQAPRKNEDGSMSAGIIGLVVEEGSGSGKNSIAQERQVRENGEARDVLEWRPVKEVTGDNSSNLSTS